MPTDPAPIVIDPSGQFLGDDGSWSTFLIDVGTPPQQLHVLVGSQSSSTWVVSPDGCSSTDLSNCTKARGGPFDDGKSTSWTPKTVYQLDTDTALGYTGNDVNGTYGFDTLAIPGAAGVATVSVSKQVVASITTDAFYVGLLGVNAAMINFTSATDTSPSLLTSMKDQNLIPSRSFGYTAGASYRGQGGVNGSLTLGGYDSSRIVPNDVMFTFTSGGGPQLVASLQGISYADSKTQTSLLSNGISVNLDSTVPYLWLPQVVCTAFEKAFGIQWDPIANLYLVNNTHHQTLVKTNASVSFLLSNSLSGPAVNITLPYASFDLLAQPPLVQNTSRYFPLQRGNDPTAYTLGRTFFQEAFMFVDYDNSNFSVSQAVSTGNTQSHIVAIGSSNTTGSSPSNPSPTGAVTKTTSNNSSSGIGSGAIAGIVVAVILIGLGLLIGGWFYMRRRRSKKQQRIDSPAEGPPPEKPIVVDDEDEKDSPEAMEGPSTKMDLPAPGLVVSEAPQSPPYSEIDGDAFFPPGSPGKPSELPGHYPTRSELSTPEPPMTPELGATRDIKKARSELSTPEPIYSNTELPSGDVRQEMPSPNPSDGDSEGGNSPKLPLQRPTSDRFNSSDSESGFTHDGMRLFTHIDTGGAGGDFSKRSKPVRKDSSESGVSAPTLSPVSPIQSPTRRPVPNNASAIRPRLHQRLNSTDSDSISTRMQLTPAEAQAVANILTDVPPSKSATEPASTTPIDPKDAEVEISEKAAGKKPAA